MYSVTDRRPVRRICAIALTGAMMAAAACSGSQNDDRAAAEALEQQAQERIESGDYAGATALMDSVDRAYPREVEVRRRVLKMRTTTRTAMLEQQLQRADSIIAACETEIQGLEGKFSHIPGGEAAGYYAMKGAHVGSFDGKTAVEARISEKDISYFIVANNASGKIGVCQIILHTSEGDMPSEAIPAGDGRRGDLDQFGTDLATFAPSEVDSLGSRLYSSGATVSGVTLVGSKGRTKINVSGAQGAQFAAAWRYAHLSRKLRQARLLRDKIERDVIVARDHQANL